MKESILNLSKSLENENNLNRMNQEKDSKIKTLEEKLQVAKNHAKGIQEQLTQSLTQNEDSNLKLSVSQAQDKVKMLKKELVIKDVMQILNSQWGMIIGKLLQDIFQNNNPNSSIFRPWSGNWEVRETTLEIYGPTW